MSLWTVAYCTASQCVEAATDKSFSNLCSLTLCDCGIVSSDMYTSMPPHRPEGWTAFQMLFQSSSFFLWIINIITVKSNLTSVLSVSSVFHRQQVSCQLHRRIRLFHLTCLQNKVQLFLLVALRCMSPSPGNRRADFHHFCGIVTIFPLLREHMQWLFFPSVSTELQICCIYTPTFSATKPNSK